jgi:regulatory protein
MDDRPYQRAWNLSLWALGRAPKTRKEMVDYLARKKTADNIIKRVLDRLQELRFIDDRQLAKAWSKKRIREGRAEFFIKNDLAKKGISRELIQETMEQLSQELAAPEDRAWDVLSRKAARLKKCAPQKVYQQLGGFLLRRGFDHETVGIVLRKYFKDRGPDYD